MAGGELGDDADAATKFALLLMTLRFIGVDDDVSGWTQVVVVFALVQGLAVFPITAGDAGVSEIASIGPLTAAAGKEWVNQITAAVLIFRILTWLLIVPVGLGVLGFWRHRLRRKPPSTADSSTRSPVAHQNSNCTAARSATRPVMWSAMNCWCSGWSR